MNQDPKPRTGRFGVGALSKEIEVKQRSGEPPTWDLDTVFRYVGKRNPRVDAVAKATGRARYPSDERPKGILYAAILRSPLPAGTVKSLDLTKARQAVGVQAVQPAVKVGSKIRYQGQELVGIAATSRDEAESALALVRIEIEKAPHVVDPQEGLREEWQKKADALPTSLEDIAASKEGKVRLELFYETQTQMHHPLEPHGITASWIEDESGPRLEVWASTQGTFGMKQGLERSLKMQGKVTVHTEFMGGGFGSKLSPGVEARLCAELSRETKKPVHCYVDRRAEALSVGNRPASIQVHEIEADAKGRLSHWTVESLGFPGYGGSGRIRGSKRYYNIRGRDSHQDKRGNTGAARAFRAPGHPQGYFGSECSIDEIAYRVGWDPLEFRIENLGKDSIHANELEKGAEAIAYRRHRNAAPGRVEDGQRSLRGVGMAISSWFSGGNGRNAVLCRIHPDGRIEVRNGAQDIGTGTRTVLAICAAEELGQDIEAIDVHLGNTVDPYGPSSGGSMTCASLAPTARKAAWLAGKALLKELQTHLSVEAKDIAIVDGQILIGGKKKMPWKEACKRLQNGPVEALAQGWRGGRGFTNGVHGCQFADLSVDLDTGAVDLHKIVAVQDCGTVIDLLTAESQVIGGVIQGIGYALYEERITDPALGRVLNTDFEHYRIPGSMEMPEIVPILPKANNGHNFVGAMGLGEPPTIPTSAAIANAIRNATGVRMQRLPMTPARVLRGLERMKIGRNS